MRHAWMRGALLLAVVHGAPEAQAPRTQVEVSASAQKVSAGLGGWRGAAVRVHTSPAAGQVWYFEGAWQRAFSDEGVYGSLMLQQELADRWTLYVALGGGSGDFFFPDARLDASVSRATGAARRVVLSAGATLVDAKRGYRDAGGWASLRVHAAPVVVEAGARVNRSSPGAVTTARGFGTLTLGTDGKDVVVARGSAGREGYQLLGATTLREFSSQEGALSWRHWFTPSVGVVVQGDAYHNDAYRRRGGSVGVFFGW